jgi:hypothetical protein
VVFSQQIQDQRQRRLNSANRAARLVSENINRILQTRGSNTIPREMIISIQLKPMICL